MKLKTKILFLFSGPAFLEVPSPFRSRFEWLSKCLSGYVITPVGKQRNVTVVNVDNFEIHTFSYYSGNSLIRNILAFAKTLKEAIRINFFCEKIDVVVANNPLVTGLAAILIGYITKSKVIIEVNGHSESAFKYSRLGGPKLSKIESIKNRMSIALPHFVLNKADMIKLVHHNQLDAFDLGKRNIKKQVFPNFVPIEHFQRHKKSDGKYILLLGFPWFLKGVDLLIEAFHKISNQFTDHKLKIVGWCPEGKEYFVKLARGSNRIELCDAVSYGEVVELMTGCSLYVLASRTDASPRVLREAMASKKPIIASNIDGVPELIKDGFNGLLFENEDVYDLSEKIKMVLSNKSLANKLAENGCRYVQKNLSEEKYITQYSEMISKLIDA